MADLTRDICYMNDLFIGTKDSHWDTVFPCSTEDTEKVIKLLDVKDKDVYAVLSSSEIVFLLKLYGAKTIDTFDINNLTYRYYFFRKWLLQYGVVDATGLKRYQIDEVIRNRIVTKNKDEEESVEFWNKYLKNLENCSHYSELLFSFYNYRFFYFVQDKYSINYKDRIPLLVEMLKDFELHFDHLDILTKQEKEFKKKYDIVFITNILDLESDIKGARDNLYNLLKDGGYVVASNIVNHPYFDIFEYQKKVFSELFEYEELYREPIGQSEIKYYKYIKK